MSDETFFRAAEYASCLGCSAQNVTKLLKGIAPTDKKIAGGLQVRAWSFSSLPSPLVTKLAKGAHQHGFRTPLQFLQNSPRRSVTPRLACASDKEVSRAQKLFKALSPCLRMPASTSVAELARIASPVYEREFGKPVSDRFLRKLITRAIERDRGERNFDRVELYLSPQPKRKRRSPHRSLAAFRFEELDDALTTIVDRARPTASEIAYCWREILRLVDDRIASGASEIKLKQQLRNYIVRSAPFLGATPALAKRNLNRKLREAIDRGGIDQVVDGRASPKRPGRKPSDFSASIKLLAQHAAFFCSGRESQAYRELHEGTAHNGARFSEGFRAAYPFDCRQAKSRIPNCVRNAVRPIIEAVMPLVHGLRTARLAMPSIHRDWSEVRSGDSYTSDDETLNHYVVDWCDGGEYEFDGRRFNVVRPQCLPVVDERTGNPLGFSLIPAPTYNSWQIRTLITRICMRREIGLPFRQFLFEKSIWASRNAEALARWSAIDESFARHGVQLRVRHATTPKAKVIEQVIGALQNLDEFAPGYIGRGEQRVKFERVQNFLQRLKRVGQPIKAEVDPTEMLMTMSQCEEMLASVMLRFANEPQNGDRLQGLSPSEGWEQLSGGRAHVVVPESLRYLLSTAESVQTVTHEGIMLRIGRRKNYYCGSEQLGSLIGEKVRVRYNPELPEQVVVSHIASDPHARNPFAVPLFERIPARSATLQEFAQAREHQNRFVSYGRALYRELAPKSNITICRSEIGSPDLRAAGEAHNRLERQCIKLETERETQRSSIKQLAARQNLVIDPAKVRRPGRVVERLLKAAEAEERIKALESAQGGQL